jgi:hypothetical protein|uniref:Uncharacterized protein n=1 Tax=Mus musculus TaxID=10090 RepID=Q3UFN6_MOUSE|nr:unnamed protein product [Mus musculus]
MQGYVERWAVRGNKNLSKDRERKIDWNENILYVSSYCNGKMRKRTLYDRSNTQYLTQINSKEISVSEERKIASRMQK